MDLWQQVTAASQRALNAGQLLSIPTRAISIVDQDVTFLVRVVTRLAEKPHVKAVRVPQATNPFLPYDPQMFVADISETHVGLLNKFNVVDNHVLIVTKKFEPQFERLTGADLTALAQCLNAYPSLGFYNSAPAAGASQPHRHLQLIPLPFYEGIQPSVPMQTAMPTRRPAEPCGIAQHIDSMPFAHEYIQLPKAKTTHDLAAALIAAYDQLLSARGWATPDEHTAYNLLATREWMMLIPRRQDAFEQVPVNAMGFAGAMFAKNEQQLATIKRVGPMEILKRTADSAP